MKNTGLEEASSESGEGQGQATLRVKVAKLCGIKPTTSCPDCFGTGYTGSESDHWPCDECKTTGRVKPYYVSPDYPNDLNACAEFEKGLTWEQSVRYRIVLMFNSDGPNAAFWSAEAALCHATAEQRCRAFIATMDEPSVPGGNENQPAPLGKPKQGS